MDEQSNALQIQLRRGLFNLRKNCWGKIEAFAVVLNR